MRMLVKVTIPTAAGTKAIQDGSIGKIVGEFLEKWKPEAAYFGADDGLRTSFFVLDLKDPATLPPMLEPLFMQLEAKISISPVMNAADLKAGISALH